MSTISMSRIAALIKLLRAGEGGRTRCGIGSSWRWVFVFTFLLPSLALGNTGERIALVIGNAAYGSAITSLSNPENDARAVARTLRSIGFKVIDTLSSGKPTMNLNYRSMRYAIESFARQSRDASVALLYYSGHGIEKRGRNYLVPTDAKAPSTEWQMQAQNISLDRILEVLDEGGARLKVVILDACRNAPFVFDEVTRGMGGFGKGLARTEAPRGTMVVYSAGARQEALDGLGSKDKSANGVFTRVLIEEIIRPGLRASEVFERVSARTEDLAKSYKGHIQQPAIYANIRGKFYFNGAPVPVAIAPPRNVEDVAWKIASKRDQQVAYEAYLVEYPSGRWASAARIAMAGLPGLNSNAGPQPQPQPQPQATLSSPHLPANDPIVEPELDTTKDTERLASVIPSSDAGSLNTRQKFGQVFWDCEDCPHMVVIGPGTFLMGSPAGESHRRKNEASPTRIVIANRFAMAKVEVTVGRFMRFVDDSKYRPTSERDLSVGGGCTYWTGSKWLVDANRNWRSPGFQQGDDHPVVCVSTEDIRTYTAWLSKRSGQTYRMPSEAEWEYAARSGMTSSGPWGEDSGQACEHGNVSDRGNRIRESDATFYCNDQYRFTGPVGQFRANGFGLYDMMGNVWESVSGCGTLSRYADTAKCVEASISRGGGWNSSIRTARVAVRAEQKVKTGSVVRGFRIARSLAQ